jgi:hypothetical protein
VAGQSIEMKRRIAEHTLNQAAAQALGAWVIKNTKAHIARLYPAILANVDTDSKAFKENVKNRWGMWSGK